MASGNIGKLTFIPCLFSLLLTLNASADVNRAQLTTAVENREPVDNLQGDVVGETDQFTRVIYFTHITKMAGETLRHIWLYNNEPMANVVLNIGSDNWRTYSSKRIKPQWQGDWRVEVWHGETLLNSQGFSFRIPEKEAENE